jgi:hypothetical protein
MNKVLAQIRTGASPWVAEGNGFLTIPRADHRPRSVSCIMT